MFPVLDSVGRGRRDAFADARDKLDVCAREPFRARDETLWQIAEENEGRAHERMPSLTRADAYIPGSMRAENICVAALSEL